MRAQCEKGVCVFFRMKKTCAKAMLDLLIIDNQYEHSLMINNSLIFLMETIQRGPNPLLSSLLVLIGTTAEMWHFKPCPTHRMFSILTYWRDLQVCSLYPQNTLSKWDSGTAVGPSSSDTLFLPPVWHHKLYPVTLSGFTNPKGDILQDSRRKGKPASLPSSLSSLLVETCS